MPKDSNITYKFASYTAIYITLIFALCLSVFFYWQNIEPWWFMLIFSVLFFFICFYIIQNRVQKFIYKRVKKIYDDVSMLDPTAKKREYISTNMDTLTKEVARFAQGKKLEIEGFKNRENYRKEFIGNISHELKTPLFTVQGYILTLLDGAMKDKSVRKKYLQRANKGVERLIYIVKDLDMITKLESGFLSLDKEVFDIVGLIESVFDLLEMKSIKKNITLMFDGHYLNPIMVYADKERIQQILTNLVVNSIKYGKTDGTTEVAIEMLSKTKILVRITDNGEGIEKSKIPRLFERFFRVDRSGSRREGGSGLGLAIVKHLVEAHNENIYVESQYGIGSEFSFTLEKAK